MAIFLWYQNCTQAFAHAEQVLCHLVMSFDLFLHFILRHDLAYTYFVFALHKGFGLELLQF